MSVWATSKTQSYQLPVETARPFPAWPLLRRRPLVWLNLACLDAPMVAILWQTIFARTFHLEVPAASRWSLFLTAWLIYLADRFADAIVLPSGIPKSLRQEFCLRHRRFWVGLLVIVAGLDVSIIWSRLDHQIFVRGLWLGSIAIIYLTVNLVFGKLWQLLPLKELTIGFLFAWGTTLVLLPQLATSFVSIWAIFLFGYLCALNCIGIALWEQELDQTQAKHTLPTLWPGIRLWFRLACLGLIFTGLVFGLTERAFDTVFWCIALSALVLGALDCGHQRIRQDELTALADLALFTPLLGIFLK